MGFELTEHDVYEAFDVMPPEEQGSTPTTETPGSDAQTPPATGEPAGSDTPNSSTQMEGAADAPTADAGEQEPEEEDGGADSGAGTGDTGGKPPLTPEQRRENAARRRQAETQAAVDQAVAAEREKHQKELADFFQAASLKNTITGKPITSMEEFNAWKQDFAAAKLQRELKAGKLTPEALNQAIAQNPAVQQVQQMARESEEAKRRAAEAEAKVRIDAELKEIGKMDPTIKGPEDLLKMPKAKEFYAYVKRGFSFLEAYKMANFDTLTTRTAEAARQQAMTNARGKNHLTGTRQQGAGALSVPADELAMFRAFNPDATDEQIQEFYNRNKRK